MRPPVHLVPPAATHHGVTRCARDLADATGAEVSDRSVAGRPQHVHFTDRLFGLSPEAAAGEVIRLCADAPTTLTLHDVPQPGDGPSFARRSEAYARVVRHARGWVTNSHHEHDLLLTHTLRAGADRDGEVIPLPLVPLPLGPTPGLPPASADAAPGGTVGVLGWVYPGKGHREVVTAAARLAGGVEVVALGAVSPGHDAEARDLADLAADLGVRFRITGPLDDRTLAARLQRVSVGVAAHRNLSASGSINTWISAGRRPLVRESAYAREMARLRPGSLTLVDDDGLVEALRLALAEPGSTVLGPDAVTAPHVDAVAASYLAWWAR